MVLYTFYRIVCNDTDVKYCYVGSTQNFTRRKYQHKSSCESVDFKVYQMIRENGGWSNWSMIKIEETECETKLDARKRERELLEHFGNGMNVQVPGMTTKESSKQYREQNKERIRERANKKYECECGGRYTHNNKSIHLKSQKHQNFLQENNIKD